MPNTSASGGYLTPSSSVVDDDDLIDIFTEAVAGITALPGQMVRPKWQPKEPKRPDSSVNWCAVGITTTQSDAGPVIQHVPTGGDENLGQDLYTRHQNIEVLATFYGPGAKGNAQLLSDGLSIPQNIETLQLNSISFVSAGTIIAVPESINMQWLKRYDLLLYFRRRIDRAYDIQNVKSANVQLDTSEGYSAEIIVDP